MREKEISEKIATKLAEMHNIQVSFINQSHSIEHPTMESYFQNYYQWAESASKICTKEDFKIVNFDLLKPEIDSLVSLIQSEEFEVLFGHHDLQHGNILMNSEGKLMFVDFECVSHALFYVGTQARLPSVRISAITSVSGCMTTIYRIHISLVRNGLLLKSNSACLSALI